MRQVRDRRPSTFFRGTELPRLLTMVVMLGVLVLLMDLARQPKTWRWIASDDAAVAEKDAAKTRQQQRPAVYDGQPAAEGPTDLDPAEQDAAREEFAAVADKMPLDQVEMPAYWRLMSWERNQSTDELRNRAERDVTFAELWQQPGEWRGKLVEIPVHVRRILTVKRVAENELGLKTIYEVFGWNDQSQPYWYWMIVPELPPEMPRGENIYEEATFVGYFLKLLPYEDREGKTRATPLLIGRLIWHPDPGSPLARRGEWNWTWYLIAALVVLFAVRWGLSFLGRARRGPSIPPYAASGDEKAVEAWLDGEDGPIAPDEPVFDVEGDPPGAK